MKLNICCSTPPWPEGYHNVDIVQPCNQIADLSKQWPWDSNSIEEIRAFDAIEHLPDKIHTMNEAHRILVPGGLFDIKVPTTDGYGAWCDPTHVSYWNRLSFDYFVRGTAPYERFPKAYGITACFDIVREELRRWPNGVVDLNILLRAVK